MKYLRHEARQSVSMTTRAWIKPILICLLSLAISADLSGLARAQSLPKPIIQMKEAVTISRVGDANFTVDVKLSTRAYTVLKANTPNTALLLRRLGLGGQSWFQIEGIQGDWEDGTNTVRIRWVTRGLARAEHGDTWQAPLANGYELVMARDNVAVFSGAISVAGSVATDLIQVKLPEGSKDVHLLHSPTRLAFHMPKRHSSGGSNPSLDLELQVRPKVMTCLAKLYSNPAFSKLWVARTVVRNNGDQVLHDFRIRFHLADYTTAWGPWNRCSAVMPGQTVVDAYFPIFDLDKVARLSGTSPATLETEYQHRQADGREVHNTDARTIQLLGHNEVLYTNLPADEIVSFQDRFNLGKIILASFVAHNDPVIQQLAGWVSGQAGGAAASLNDADAVRFLQALYVFMADNRIACQTPPADMVDGQVCQHVKYGRDVLRNHAGTCIDLAILYGSACEAVGLRPVLFLVPGHCFPAVYLPRSHKLIAVETTMVGHRDFDSAVKRGAQNVREAAQAGQYIMTDVVKLQGQGVHGLELPPLSSTVLKDWGYHVVAQTTTPRTTSPAATNGTATNSTTEGQASSPLTGKWAFRGRINGLYYHLTANLGADGTFWSRVEVANQTGASAQANTAGTYTVDSQTLTTTTTTGARQVYYYAIQNTSDGMVLQVYMNGLRCWVPFRHAA